MLWTRVQTQRAGTESVTVAVEVATLKDFTNLVLRQTYPVSPASDYTLRVLVENLQPDTIYYYRFIAPDGTTSLTGRTWTAPQPDTPQKSNSRS